MIQHTVPLTLSLADREALQAIQQLVDNEASYADKVTLAAHKWGNKPSSLFGRIRSALATICIGSQRCSYCEDSLADEIEHVRPKSWFPEQAFDPSNYLFACGPCNGPKSNQYAVTNNLGVLTEAYRIRNTPVLPPPIGQEALLNPWHDNPADFFFLDLENTFRFKPKSSLNNRDTTRAAYTIKVLNMNKDPLSSAREAAFKDFAGRLKDYYLALKDNESSSTLTLMKNEILVKQHITVWREMQRQSTQLLKLQRLFQLVPGAVNW